jgi:serine/threonine protein kinase
LKPDNILVCGKDTLKVADFGLARLACGVVGAGGAGGALICQAPETLLGINPTPASDVYALGLMLYEMLAGKNPLTEVGLEASAAKRHEQYRQLQIQAREAGLPPLPDYEHSDRPAGEQLKDHPALLELIERCLRFKATERYDNARILLQALERYASGQGVVVFPVKEEQSVKSEVPTPALTLDRLLTEVQILLRQGRIDEARARCEQAQGRFQQSGKPYRWLAEIQLAQRQWKEALQICAQGIKVDPNEPELLETTAHAYDMGGQMTAATEMRKRAMALRQKARK